MINNVKKRLPRLPVSSLFWMLLLLLLLAGSVQAVADVSIIANKSLSVDTITAKEAKKIWLAKIKQLAGTKLKLADLPMGNKFRDQFYGKVVKKSAKKLKAYWAKVVFSGKGIPPKIFKTDIEVINWVASTPGAVGYVDSAAVVDDSVKVLMLNK